MLLKYDPLKCTYSELIPHVTTALSTASSTSHSKSTFSNNTVEIPVNYDGEDLESAAHHANLSSSSDVALAHQNGTYRVYFLGFTGGFPYLGGLPSSLASVPRLDTPRQIVPKGSVGIAAGQTGVYTLDTPGGWHLIGRTPMSLFDATKDPPSVLKAGDIVKFVPTSTDSTTSSSSSSKTIQHEPTNPIIEILKPGPLTTVQDLGRDGYARHGVSRSGVSDEIAMRMGNTLLSNDENAAVLEVSMGGLKIQARSDCAIALTGADCAATLDSKPLQRNQVVFMKRDQELELGYARDGSRAYLCVQGGIDVPKVLGSRSSDVRAGFGNIITQGDVLGRGFIKSEISPMQSKNDLHVKDDDNCCVLKLLPGPGDPSSSEMSFYETLQQKRFKVTPRTERMACVLTLDDDGDDIAPIIGGQQISEPCVQGM